ncbi:Tat pathway signal sequence domain protein [Thiohalocapsa halophila]
MHTLKPTRPLTHLRHCAARCRALACALAVASIALVPAMPAAASTETDAEPPDAIEIELNKLEPAADACRPYLVFHNRGETALDALTLELVLFDADGFILRHFTLDAAPLAAGKTSVKLFEIPGVACSAIGRILLNQVTACAGSDGALDHCLQRIRAASRLPVDFFK